MLASSPSFTNDLSCFSVAFSCLQNQCYTGDSYFTKKVTPSCILTEETFLGRLHLNDAGLGHSPFLAEEFATYQTLFILLGKDKTTTKIFEPNLKQALFCSVQDDKHCQVLTQRFPENCAELGYPGACRQHPLGLRTSCLHPLRASIHLTHFLHTHSLCVINTSCVAEAASLVY